MSDLTKTNRDLISAVLSAAMLGGDAIICGKTRAIFCITPKAEEAIKELGKANEDSVEGTEVKDFLRKLVDDKGLTIYGTMPDGSLVKLTTNPADHGKVESVTIPSPGKCNLH